MNYKSIKAFPDLDIRHIFAPRLNDDPVLGSVCFQMYSSGRSAIYHAIKSLNLSPEKVFLLPAFHCGVEVEAIIRAGCQVDFYRVNRDFSIDFQHLAGKITAQTAGIFVIHYFGFPQELSCVKQLCAQYASVLIEDCAHALYSRNTEGQLLGTLGQYGIFSLQKTIALPNGGGLLVNALGSKKADNGGKYYDNSLLKWLIRSALEFENLKGGVIGSCAGKLLSLYRTIKGQSDEPAQVATDSFDMRRYYEVPRFGYENDISSLSRHFVGKESFEHIIFRRRSNYILLETLLEKAGLSDRLIYRRLPEGCCPLCLPISVDRRDEVVVQMQVKGVDPFVFGRFAHPLLDKHIFPDATFLADHIVGLPVHQQLGDKDMETIVNVLRDSIT